MKNILLALSLMSFTAGIALADECKMPPVKTSKELDKLKALAGHWEGNSNEGPVAVDYKVTSGGTAVVETLFPNTDHEMVSVYHDEDGGLVMTHYCMLGNQPKLALTKATPEHMSFELSKHQTAIHEKTETHMHGMEMSFIEPNTIVEKWSGFEKGRENHSTTFQLKRAG